MGNMTLARVETVGGISPFEVAEDPLTQRDYELMKAAMPKWRDLLILKCLRSTGVRINELLSITPQHVRSDGVGIEFLIKRGKKRHKDGAQVIYEPMPLPPELAVEVLAWVKGNGYRATQKIFPITDRQVRNVFAAAGLSAIGRRVHPHELRGLYIKWLMDAGLNVSAAAKMVGHEDVRTTQKHYYKLSADDRRRIQSEIPV
jgi:integrase